MKSALIHDDSKRMVECPCGMLHPDTRECTHGDAEPYTARFRERGYDGVEAGVLGPEGNRIPLTRKIFEADYIQHEWFDRCGRCHLGQREPYAEIEDQLAAMSDD